MHRNRLINGQRQLQVHDLRLLSMLFRQDGCRIIKWNAQLSITPCSSHSFFTKKTIHHLLPFTDQWSVMSSTTYKFGNNSGTCGGNIDADVKMDEHLAKHNLLTDSRVMVVFHSKEWSTVVDEVPQVQQLYQCLNEGVRYSVVYRLGSPIWSRVGAHQWFTLKSAIPNYSSWRESLIGRYSDDLENN